MAYFENLAGMVGGLEKILCDFSNAMTAKGHNVYIITNDDNHGYPYFELDKKIPIINLREISRKQGKISLCAKVMRETFRLLGKNYVRLWKEKYRNGYIQDILPGVLAQIKPDVIISYNNETTGQLFRANIETPYITMLHNDPDFLCKVMTSTERKGIAASQYIQVLTPCFVKKAQKFFPNANIIYIPNEVEQYEYQVRRLKKQHTIICVARLNKGQKRQHLLIQAFSKIAPEHPDWNLKFAGTGDPKYIEELRQLIKNQKMEKQIFLIGPTSDILNEYKKADIFAFPSAFEGFGLALVEAMSSGLPCIGFRSASAVNEIILNNQNGILVDDGISALANGLSLLMNDENLRIQLGEYAHVYAKQYEAHFVWEKWEKLLEGIQK